MPITVEFSRRDYVALCGFLTKELEDERTDLKYSKPESESALEHEKKIAKITRWLECMYETEEPV